MTDANQPKSSADVHADNVAGGKAPVRPGDSGDMAANLPGHQGRGTKGSVPDKANTPAPEGSPDEVGHEAALRAGGDAVENDPKPT